MKSLKRNQVIIFVIALMLVSAGYLNYTAMNKDKNAEEASTNTIEYAGIGDAKLVGSNSVETGNEINSNTVIGSAVTEENTNTVNNNTINNTVTTSAPQTNDQYFSSSRLRKRYDVFSKIRDLSKNIRKWSNFSRPKRNCSNRDKGN